MKSINSSLKNCPPTSVCGSGKASGFAYQGTQIILQHWTQLIPGILSYLRKNHL